MSKKIVNILASLGVATFLTGIGNYSCSIAKHSSLDNHPLIKLEERIEYLETNALDNNMDELYLNSIKKEYITLKKVYDEKKEEISELKEEGNNSLYKNMGFSALLMFSALGLIITAAKIKEKENYK
ncbi:MAG: hypothetical protein KKF52_04150 [Nanoarchaeota archaeon]|nr:hypothetical protein [Nanoarchaeota archaeon]MBU4242399.1 hypothetical protein [Nanoarchaeota archaeon]